MPNWSYNTIVVKGTENDILAFVNSGAETKVSTIDDIKNASLSLNSLYPMPQTFVDYDTTNNKKQRKDFASDGEYDKYSENYEDAKKYQEEMYGVVGWFDWRVKNWGTQWDASFDFFSLDKCDDEMYVLSFQCETAWTLPMEFLMRMAQKFPSLKFAIRAYEESGIYNVAIDVSNQREIASNISNEIDDIVNDKELDYEDIMEQIGDLSLELDNLFFEYCESKL